MLGPIDVLTTRVLYHSFSLACRPYPRNNLTVEQESPLISLCSPMSLFSHRGSARYHNVLTQQAVA